MEISQYFIFQFFHTFLLSYTAQLYLQHFEFYLLAAFVGCFQGGIQGSSRGLFGKLIPAEKAGEFFGLFNVFGKAGAILGPLMVGTLLSLYGNIRIALLPIAILFILGGLLLIKVRIDDETI
jgi:UMF1 family MFS transporter